MARFKPFRRPRKAQAKPYGEADARKWRKLVKAALCAARAPLAPATALSDAAEACRRAVLPPGHVQAGSIFMALMAEGRTFHGKAEADRRGAVDRLFDLATSCGDALDHPPPSARPRRDIFD